MTEDETGIADTTDWCRQGYQGHSPGNTQAVFGRRKDPHCAGCIGAESEEAAGFEDYLTKPIKVPEVLDAIAAHIGDTTKEPN